MVFAVNENQLNSILKEVLPALHDDSKLWIAYPKTTSKISSDLNRDCSWSALTGCGYTGIAQVALDHVWSALWWKKGDCKELLEAAEITFEGVSAVEEELDVSGFFPYLTPGGCFRCIRLIGSLLLQ